MWLEALELCLERLKVDRMDFGRVVCISGCSQQHGSVWWRLGSEQILAEANPNQPIELVLRSAFSLDRSPVWLDSSTVEECRIMENFVGGSTRLSEITGSRAYERFAGPQIMKIYRKQATLYRQTERITLISNFLSTVLAGHFTPFDAADLAGTNMMEIRNKKWSHECLSAIVAADDNAIQGLKARLGCFCGDSNNIVESYAIVGRISTYFVERYGFSSDCLISSFTGDTPSSMAGLCVSKDELVVSLGTSDTACFWMNKPEARPNIHLSLCPFYPGQYIGMTGFKNGSKTRERIRDACASSNWAQFGRLLEETRQGNDSNVGFYFDLCEIYPPVRGDYRFNAHDEQVDSFSPRVEVRACLEGQFMRLYNQLNIDELKPRFVLVTGGASTNRSILQVFADVFRIPVKVLDIPNTACLGAAYLSRFAFEIHSKGFLVSFDDLIAKNVCKSHKGITIYPREKQSNVYELLTKRYSRLQATLKSSG